MLMTSTYTVIERRPIPFHADPFMTAEMSSGHHHMVHSASNGLSLNYDEVDGQTEVKPVPQQGEGHRHVRLGEDKGLFTVKGMSIVWLWYFFSCVTLFLNKHILSTLKCDATILGESSVH